DEVEAIFARALALDPRERTQTVGEFWDALTAALGIQHVTGRIALREQGRQAQRVITAGFESIAPGGALAPPEPVPPAPRAPAVAVHPAAPTRDPAAPARPPLQSSPLG